MKISIGSDHAAWEQKAALAAWLEERGHHVVDRGTTGPASVDYPDFALPVCGDVVGGDSAFGILLCGSGIGISIAANKVRGIRAALLHEPYGARMCREHNDANVICFGARVTGMELIKASVEAYMAAAFQGGNHARRVGKISAIEGGAC
jgi:ribose 5-phosphate isomerase B